MAKILIGLAAKQCAGKGTFVTLLRELLPQYTVGQNTSSKSLKAFLDRLKLPFNREHTDPLVLALEEFFEGPALSDKMKKILMRDFSQISIFDGMRLPSDFTMMKDLAKEWSVPLIFVYITATDEICLARASARGEKDGENKLTPEEFQKQQKAYTARFIPELGRKYADWIIVNERGIDEYRERMKEFIQKKIMPHLGFRPDT